MTDRRDIRVSLHNGDEMHATIPAALAWLQKLEKQVPPEFKDQSVFEVELERDYYDSGAWINFRVYYDRPETDAEMAERRAQDAANAAAARVHNERQERAIYAQLKQKYG